MASVWASQRNTGPVTERQGCPSEARFVKEAGSLKERPDTTLSLIKNVRKLQNLAIALPQFALKNGLAKSFLPQSLFPYSSAIR